MSIGRIIVNARHKKGMSQKELAQEVGICRCTLGYYERECRVPSIEILKRLSTVLDVPLKVFLDKGDTLLYNDRELMFIRLLREEEELYSRVLSNPYKEIAKLKNYSKIESFYIE